jgi:hypothetical protein
VISFIYHKASAMLAESSEFMRSLKKRTETPRQGTAKQFNGIRQCCANYGSAENGKVNRGFDWNSRTNGGVFRNVLNTSYFPGYGNITNRLF